MLDMIENCDWDLEELPAQTSIQIELGMRRRGGEPRVDEWVQTTPKKKNYKNWYNHMFPGGVHLKGGG